MSDESYLKDDAQWYLIDVRPRHWYEKYLRRLVGYRGRLSTWLERIGVLTKPPANLLWFTRGAEGDYKVVTRWSSGWSDASFLRGEKETP